MSEHSHTRTTQHCQRTPPPPPLQTLPALSLDHLTLCRLAMGEPVNPLQAQAKADATVVPDDLTRVRLDEIRQQLAIPIPAFILDSRRERSEHSDSQHGMRLTDFDGRKGAIPLSVVCLDDDLDVPAVVDASVQNLLDRLQTSQAAIGTLRQRCLEPSPTGLGYTIEINLEMLVASATGFATLSVLEAIRPGEKWRVGHDGPEPGLVEGDLICRPIDKPWLGAVIELKGWTDEDFDDLHAYGTSMEIFPILATYVKDEKTQFVYWSTETSDWRAVPTHLRSMVQVCQASLLH